MHRIKYLIVIVLTGLIVYSAAALTQVVQQLHQAEQTLTQLQDTEQMLSLHIRELQSDMSEGAFRKSAERIAREKLGLLMPGETVYRKADH